MVFELIQKNTVANLRKPVHDVIIILVSSSFSLWLLVQSHEYKHTCSFTYFLECVLLFLDDNKDEEWE